MIEKHPVINVCHIHVDAKFNSLRAFRSDIFANTHIYILEKEEDVSLRNDFGQTKCMILSRDTIERVVNTANTSDLVVLYFLNNTNAFICNKIKKNIPVIWRFFGAELYGGLNNFILSETTKKCLSGNEEGFLDRLRSVFRLVSLYGFNYKKNTAINMAQISAVAMLYADEYEYLSKYYHLPPFIQIAWSEQKPKKELVIKEKIVILGNSRNCPNNHIDILDIIRSANIPSDIMFKMPFNYGPINNYSCTVTQKAREIRNLELLDTFIPSTEYSKLFQRATAFVFNGKRQMAMGNIILALMNNMKIYLNTENSAYCWFKKEGFLINTIEDFSKDIESGNIFLSSDESDINIEALHNLSQKYNYDKFINDLFKLINFK